MVNRVVRHLVGTVIDKTVGKDLFCHTIKTSSVFKKYLPNIHIPEPSEEFVKQRIIQSLQNISDNSRKFNEFALKNSIDKKALIIEPRGGFYPRIILGMIAKRLMLHGYESLFINCEDLPVCNGWSVKFPRPPGYCDRCLSFSNQLMNAFGLKATSVDELIDPVVRRDAKQIVTSLSREGIWDFTYHGFPLGSYLNVSLCSYFFRGSPANDEKSTSIMRDFLYGLIVLYHAYEALLEQYKADVVIMTNGRFFWFKLAYEMCKARGLQVISLDDFGSTGGTGNRWMFSHHVPIAELDLTSYWMDWQDISLSEGEKVFLNRNFIQGAIKNEIYYKNPQLNWEKICFELSIDPSADFDVMFTNLTWDSTCIDKNTCFRDMFDWIFYTIELYLAMDRKLLIRVHPAEKEIFGLPSLQKVEDEINKKYGKLPENIIIVPPDSNVSSYELLKKSQLNIIYTSTLGLEVAVRGIPVIVAGMAHYRNKGFTVDINSKQQYNNIVSRTDIVPKLTESQMDIARRYAFFYMYRTKIPLEFYDADFFKIRKFKIESFDELLPGNNDYLDLVVDGILNSTPIILNRSLSNKLYGIL